jgi:poly(3-hydroxybutyrate) depolymerase
LILYIHKKKGCKNLIINLEVLMKIYKLFILVCLAVFVLGCSDQNISEKSDVVYDSDIQLDTDTNKQVEESDSETNEQTDTHTQVDTSPDTQVDTSLDTQVDTSLDTQVDTSLDTQVDTSPDTQVDTSLDTQVDTSPDTQVDTSPDTQVDTSPDTQVDTGGTDFDGTTGCGKPLSLSNGRNTINVNGLEREYIIDIPDNYDINNAYTLVFAWHWMGGSADDVAGSGWGANAGYYGLKALANDTAIFVAPHRYSEADNGWPNTNGRDIDFFKAMIDLFFDSLCIDESKIFSTGFSYGGMMSFAVGREMAEIVRAIAPYSGALWTPHNDNNNLPTAAWIAHGTGDDVVGIDAGRSARDSYISRNNCSSNTVPVDPAPCVEYQGCDEGYPVVWCEFNGGHSTPNFAAEAVWRFFTSLPSI